MSDNFNFFRIKNMALLRIVCKECSHEFYRIAVACNREGVDLSCPSCEFKDNQVFVEKPRDGSSPFAGCKHV